MTNIEELAQRIEKIEKRNQKVEADKAWETSLTRKTLIGILTYFVITLFLFVIKVRDPFLNAIVPAIGFFISTLTIPFIKSYWIKRIYKR